MVFADAEFKADKTMELNDLVGTTLPETELTCVWTGVETGERLPGFERCDDSTIVEVIIDVLKSVV